MTLSMAERHRMSVLGWLATVAMSLSLFPAMQEKRFILAGAVLAAVVVAIGMVCRQLHLPTVVAPVIQVIVVVELLLLEYGDHLRWLLFPTATTFSSVQTKLSAGMDVAQRFAAPVPHSPGLTLMTVGFIAAVAIAVDLLAAGLAKAPLAGLPLLALYTVPVASLPHGVPALCFIPGATAYLALLMVSERERLAHWGRHVARSASLERSGDIDTTGLSTSGRRISACALVTAVVIPIFIPGFSHSLFHGKSGIGDGDGSNLSFADPMVSLASSLHQRDPVDLVQVRSSVPPSYLRLAVLNAPGPNAWTNDGASLDDTVALNKPFPSPTGLSSAVVQTPKAMNVTLTGSYPREDSGWLPVPYDITSISMNLSFGGIPEDLGYVPSDQTIASRTSVGLAHVEDYSLIYDEVHPTAAQLNNATDPPAEISAGYEGVPAAVPAVVGEVARNVTAGAANDYERALALQSFFRERGEFTYDLNSGYGYGYKAMAKFLQLRRGFCQHFAATMAMMARTIGIPSRVVVGFLSPSRQEQDGPYVFGSRDAHAWPELYFGGVGWVRFEPTPGNGAVIPSYTHLVTVPTITPTVPTESGGGPIGRLPTDEVPSSSSAVVPQGGAGQAGSGGGLPSVSWLLVVLILLLALTPGTVRWGVRRSRLARSIDGGESCEYAWLEVRDRVIDLRLPWTGSLTPRARRRFVEPLLGGDPDGVAALDRLSLTVERSRYAGSPLADAEPGSDARDIIAAISRGTDRKQRLKAFLWPRSLMPEIRIGWGRLRSRLRASVRPAE